MATPRFRRLKLRQGRGERAAGLVEYALLTGAFLLTSVSVIGQVAEDFADKQDELEARMYADPDNPEGDTPTPTSSTTTTRPAATTTTTAATTTTPTTAAPGGSTSTTRPTTTTTVPTTTTTVHPWCIYFPAYCPSTTTTTRPPTTTTTTTRPPTTTTTSTTTTRPPTTTTTTTLPPTTTTTTRPPTTTTTTRPPTTTTTTRPPTTTSTSTTTTRPPTTTTRPPHQSTESGVGSAANIGNGDWRATATFTIRNNYNTPVANATVTVRYRLCSGVSTGCGSWQTATLPVTNASGVTSSFADLDRDDYRRVDVQVTGVSAPGLTWDGTGEVITILRPA